MSLDLSDHMRTVLAVADLDLLHLIARAAESMHMPLYAVGGLPRDLILGRSAHDFDLVVEGSAIELARSLAAQHGGSVIAHRQFRTATWHRGSGGRPENLPDSGWLQATSLDLATARTETYLRPAHLPDVLPGTIEADLRRRDFTINAIAVRLDHPYFGMVFDPLGGINDLHKKRLKVLHDRSFEDDPTRMYRAVRYEERLGFRLDRASLGLLRQAMPRVRAVSGERLRHELDLILMEKRNLSILRRLSKLRLLQEIHAALPGDSRSLRRIGSATSRRQPQDPGRLGQRALFGNWILWLMDLKLVTLRSIGRRLVFTRNEMESILAAAELNQRAKNWATWRPSKLTRKLDLMPLTAVETVYAALPFGKARRMLEQYLLSWRHIRSHMTGRDLQALGLAPGPRFRSILEALRDAWVDGIIRDRDSERRFLERLLRRS